MQIVAMKIDLIAFICRIKDKFGGHGLGFKFCNGVNKSFIIFFTITVSDTGTLHVPTSM